jgi:hypothetical protein
VAEPDAAKKDIGPPKRRIFLDAKFGHTRSPRLGIEKRYLATAAPADAACDTLARDQRRLFHAIHRTAVRALDPDFFDTSHNRRGASARTEKIWFFANL